MKRTTNKVSAAAAATSPRRGAAACGAGLHLLAVCAAAALAAASCTESPDGELPGGEHTISIRTTLGGANGADAAVKTSRAPVADGGDDARAALGDMHFLRRDGASVQTDFSGVTALAASRDASGRIVFAQGSVPMYDNTDLNAWFTAYWPATAAEGAAVTAGEKVVWTVDGSRDILLSTLDPSKSFDAGKYTAPGTAAMTLEHALAQLQVVCTVDAAASETVVRQTWGEITKIELLTSPATATYTYADNTLAYGAVGTLPLWTADYSARFEGRSHELTKDNTVLAAGMYPPSAGVVRLKVYTAKLPAGKDVSVQLAESGTPKDFVRGLTHKVTLTFGALPAEIAVTATTITPWSAGYGGTTGVGDGEYSIPAPAEGFLYWDYPHIVKRGEFFDSTFDILGPGTQSYNGWKGTVAGGSADGGNGSYADETPYIMQEKPYPKLEVAKEDELSAGVATMIWADARKACLDKTTDGGGWRLPRQSELMWVYLNKTELEKTPGFTAFTPGVYWSATEVDSDFAWYIYDDGSVVSDLKSDRKSVRCVREIHPPMPAVRDYYYSDGTTSTALDNAKTAEGIVIWVDPNDPAHFKVVSLYEPELDLAWSTSKFDVGVGAYAGIRDEAAASAQHDARALARQSGGANREILGRWLADASANTTGKTIADFPAFEYCDRLGAGWFLPAVNEVQYYMCTVYGVAPVTWDYEYNFYPNSSDAFSTLCTAAGGDPYRDDLPLMPSTEASTDEVVHLIMEASVELTAKTERYTVRCVREIQPL